MDIEFILKDLGVQRHLATLLLGTPRLFMIMQIVPFMGSSVLPAQLRVALVFACYMILHPFLLGQFEQVGFFESYSITQYVGIILSEVFVGFLIAYVASIVFLMVQSAGFFIDNQRGASMASSTDPLSGEQSSPLGSFLFQVMTYVFFTSGGFLAFLALVYASYTIWPIVAWVNIVNAPQFVLFFINQVSWLTLHVFILAGPIVIACLLVDISLGLINRFASQLNVYVLAMPIKSGLAMFLLLIYFSIFIEKTPELFNIMQHQLKELYKIIS